MRTAILTDIHANLPALEAVLARCTGAGSDRYVCLGDTVGYGAQPNECCEIIRERASFSLLGNHDAAVAGRMRYDDYYDAARNALDWTRDQISRSNRAWLASLPYTTREGAFGYCHGSPLEPEQFEYLFRQEHARELLPMLDDLARLTVVGHAHLPRAFAVSLDGVRDIFADEVPLLNGHKHIMSVGSVGQPRDGDPRACFAMIDDEANTFTFGRVAYDIRKAANLIELAGLSIHFARRLYAGV